MVTKVRTIKSGGVTDVGLEDGRSDGPDLFVTRDGIQRETGRVEKGDRRSTTVSPKEFTFKIVQRQNEFLVTTVERRTWSLPFLTGI